MPDLPKTSPLASPAFGKPRHVRLLAGEKPRRLPQAAFDQAAVGVLDDENGGAMDDHHVTGVLDADAYRFGRRINGAVGDGRAGGKADIARKFGGGVVIYRHLPGQSVEGSLVKVRIFVVFARMSGWFRHSHRILGPADCEVSALLARSRIAYSPIFGLSGHSFGLSQAVGSY